MPDRPSAIVDSHHHLWRRRDIAPEGILAAPYLQRDFLWADFQAAWEGLPVERTVFVQVRSDEEEVDFVATVAEREPALGAMIAWAPLEDEGVATHLRRLKNRPLVRGVRRNTQHEPDPLFCARPDFLRGAQRLAELGLLCEICVRHEQIEGALELAKACPETTIVLEHLGKPDLSVSPAAAWLRATEGLAALANVFCKVSVVVHSDSDPPLRAESVAPFVRHAVEGFGWERVLFGSNWPVSTALIGYGEWVDLILDVLPAASGAELDRFFAANSRRLYNLD